MHVIKVRNVHRALPEGITHLLKYGVERESRNGPVLVAPWPVTTHYLEPRERVLFWPERDANPFFHFMECLWMLAGRNDVKFLDQFVKRMKDIASDDGETYHGAYGRRWARWFNSGQDDQLTEIIKALKKDSTSRRCVLEMWDAGLDLSKDSKDLPCNTHVYFSIDNHSCLNMTVCCRSNDIIWGCYGSNAVHFSFLQEYMAAGIGCKVGGYWQVSNNFHAYRNVLDPLVDKMAYNPSTPVLSPYVNISPYPIVNTNIEDWNEDLGRFFMIEDQCFQPGEYKDIFFTDVVTPIQLAHRSYKNKHYDEALDWIEQCAAQDWKKACKEWLLRRKANFERAQDNGVNYEKE